MVFWGNQRYPYALPFSHSFSLFISFFPSCVRKRQIITDPQRFWSVVNSMLWSVILLSAIPWSHRGKHLSWDLIRNYYRRKRKFSLSYPKILTRGMTLLRETVRVFSALAKKSSFCLETEQPLLVPLTRSNKRKAQQAATASGDRMSESLCSRDSKVIIFPKTASRRTSGTRGKYVWTLGFMNLNFHANLRWGGCSLPAPQKTTYRFHFANRTLIQTLPFLYSHLYLTLKKSDKLGIRRFAYWITKSILWQLIDLQWCDGL